MRVLSLFAAAGMAATAFVAASPARADYHVIRWEGSGFCQVWDESIPTTPVPSNYAVILGSQVPTFDEAMSIKHMLLRDGTCSS